MSELRKTGLSREWAEDCLRYHNRILVGDYLHWCEDQDGLPIDDTCDEMKYCTCFSIGKSDA